MKCLYCQGQMKRKATPFYVDRRRKRMTERIAINPTLVREDIFACLEYAASLADVDFIVSWNFKHIVHYEKINGYHAVNLLHGYKQIRIYSPKEIV